MPKTILSANVNVLDLLVATIEFIPGLNIISGENGTLKTRLLQLLRNEPQRLMISEGPAGPLRMQAISPKRNAERRAFRTIFEDFRQKNQKLDSLITERSINDQTFDNYPSIGDLFYVVYDDLCKDGGNQQEKMREATTQFNSVIQKLFLNYELISNWDDATGSPNIKLIKYGSGEIPLEALSLGEQEMLSLVVNLYTSKDRYDIFLIDEPEVHLNWHLEEKLFNYLDEFCREYGKQIIVVTHSRAIFKKKFLDMAQFLFWGDDGKIHVGRQLTPEQQKKLAGDAIEIIAMGDRGKPTFFVEDGRHKEIIEALATNLGADVSVSECGNSSNVRSLFRHSKREGGWHNSYFVTDGDNQGNPFPGEDKFIHLDKYCLENYLLDSAIAAKLSGEDVRKVEQALLHAIVENRGKILKKNQFFEFLVDGLRIEHLTAERVSKLDASEVLESYLAHLGIAFSEFLKRYAEIAAAEGALGKVFPAKIVEILQSAEARFSGQVVAVPAK